MHVISTLMQHPFGEIALLLLICAFAGAVAVRLRQPVLIAYIAVGVLAGPSALALVQAHDQIDLLAQFGVAVLLFLVGLKLDVQHLRNIGPVAAATGLGQLGFTIAIGFVLMLLLGRGWLESMYVAIALTFSSTIIIVKLLSDKRELDSLHGRIAVGFLIVQDLAVVVAMMAMSSMRGPDAGAWDVVASMFVRLAGAAVLVFALMRYVLPQLVSTMARSQELLLVFAIAWGAGLAALGELAGFSKEAGAFLAGFSLASTQYREAMNARLTGLRDFLLLFFFIDLGAKLELSALGGEIGAALLLSAFVLVGNPLIVMAIMGYMGYRKRTGFMAGLTVAQISEFSIVFVAMGISLGHLDAGSLGLTTLVGLITITLSTYMILYSEPLYERLAPFLRVFERGTPHRELAVDGHHLAPKRTEILVIGLGRYGGRLLTQLHASGVPVLGVDFDPEAVRELARCGLPVRFGDAEDPAFLDSLPLSEVAWTVSTLPQWASNRAFLHALSQTPFAGKVAGVARDDSQAAELRNAQVDYVLNPYTDAADFAARMLLTSRR